MQKITPWLWFDNQAEEAASYYVSLFENSKVTRTTRYGAGAPLPEGAVMTVEFQLEGTQYVALNGGPAEFKFNESVSFLINCETQEEVDKFWDKFVADGGEEGVCGWVKDKYGLSWQVIPTALGEMMNDPDAQKAQRVMQAMLQMKKIDVAELKRAYDQE